MTISLMICVLFGVQLHKLGTLLSSLTTSCWISSDDSCWVIFLVLDSGALTVVECSPAKVISLEKWASGIGSSDSSAVKSIELSESDLS